MIIDTLIKIDSVFTGKSSDFITHNEVIGIFDSAQTMFNNHTLILFAIFGLIIPTLLYFSNKASEKRINKAIDGIDIKIESKIKEKIKAEFELIIKGKTDDLEQTIIDLTNRVKYEDENLQMKIDIPVKMVEVYSYLFNNYFNEAIRVSYEALFYSFILENDYYTGKIDNLINEVIKGYRKEGRKPHNIITIAKLTQIFHDLTQNEKNQSVQKSMLNYHNSYVRVIENINNEQ